MLLQKAHRPYPVDKERLTRCKVELARRGMSITELAWKIQEDRGYVSKIISGRLRTKKLESRIAAFFRLPVDYLFPVRTNGDLLHMEAEEKLRLA